MRIAVVFLAIVLLTALALISCLSVEDKREIRGLPRTAWVLAILLVPIGGAVAWFLAGRPRPEPAVGPGWRVGGGFPEPPRPTAPDDDPEFLRSLEQRSVSEPDEDLLRQWEEEDRSRREEEDRKRREEDRQEDERREDERRRRRDPGADG